MGMSNCSNLRSATSNYPVILFLLLLANLFFPRFQIMGIFFILLGKMRYHGSGLLFGQVEWIMIHGVLVFSMKEARMDIEVFVLIL